MLSVEVMRGSLKKKKKDDSTTLMIIWGIFRLASYSTEKNK